MSLVLVALIIVLSFFGGGSQENLQSVFSEDKFILIVELSALNCPLCLQSLTEFIVMINAFKLEQDVLGVLVMSKEGDDPISEKQMRIAEKKLRGFIKGNAIQFPFFLDKSGVFNVLDQDATALLILFDREESEIKKYTFPLTGAQIQGFLRD